MSRPNDGSVLPIGAVFEERYESLAELGAGSFGRVYRARQLSTGQLVAIKVLRLAGDQPEPGSAQPVERFRREMRICAELSHPNIVRLIDSGESVDGLLYAVFEHVPGETLAQALAREGALGVREATRLMAQVLDALACAHAQGIVHRDLKPANIMLSGTGARRNALVLDFGLGGLCEDVRRDAWRRLTQTREFMGTPLYAAPEQLAGEAPTPRADLYAWGLVLLECLTGRHPLEGSAGTSPWWRRRVAIPGWLRAHRLGRLIEVVTAPELDRRDVSVEGLLAALEATEGDALPVPPRESAASGQGERRLLTVVSCRVVLGDREGSPLDLEERDELLRAQHALAAEITARAGGIVASKLGDRVLMCFGYPQASEGDATRAARASLEIAEAVERRVAALELERGVVLDVCIGVHSGIVIARGARSSRGEARLDVVGATAEHAASLDALASPGEVLATDAVRRLLRGDFHARRTREARLGSGSGPEPVFRIERGTSETSTSEETPFVGRTRELEELQQTWRRVVKGGVEYLLVQGDAGIGKSRLLREFRRRACDGRWLECRCFPESSDAPLRPVIDLISARGDTPRELLERAGLAGEESVAVLGALLSQRDAPGEALPLSRELQKERTLTLVVALLLSMAEREPHVLAVEDLHWADPTTLELLGRLVQEIQAVQALDESPRARLLVLFTVRAEAPRPAIAEAMPTLRLPRLTREEVQAMVETHLPRDESLSPQLLDQVVSRADGVPLFVEELTRVLSEGGAFHGGAGAASSEPARTEIPGSLRSLLTARLDALSHDAAETVQVAAALGREFRYELLLATSPKDGGVLRVDLEELVQAGLLLPRRSARAESYVFKHALLRDAVYESMLRPTRRRWHAHIADALGRGFPELVAQRPELVAQHLTLAGRSGEAVMWWKRAGDRALARSAYEEAIHHCENGLRALRELPPSRERAVRELELTEALGTALISTRGYAVPEVVRTFARARALCEELSEETPLRVLWGTWGVQIVQSEREGTAELLTQFRRRAERSSDPVEHVACHAAVSTHALYRAEFAHALEQSQAALEGYDSDSFQAFVRDTGYDVGMYAFATVMVCHAILGDPAEAVQAYEQMMKRAGEMGSPYSLAIAMGYGMNYFRERRAFDQARALAERQLAFANEQRLYYWLGPAACTRGWALARLGQREGLEQVRQGLALCRSVGLRSTYPFLLAGLAEAELAVGEAEAGLEATREGLALCGTLLDRFYEAELLRLEGELLHARGDSGAALERVGRALVLGRAQGAKLYVLRAAIARARLRGDGQTREVLRDAVRGFGKGEGFGDLDQAQGLLKQLDRDAAPAWDPTAAEGA